MTVIKLDNQSLLLVIALVMISSSSSMAFVVMTRRRESLALHKQTNPPRVLVQGNSNNNNNHDTVSVVYDIKETPTEALIIENIDNLQFGAPDVEFEHPVVIRNCTIRSTTVQLFATYFLEGFQMSNCTVQTRMEWFAGGHNRLPVVMERVVFEDFVDFGNCCFHQGGLYLDNVTFCQGTNLMGDASSPVFGGAEFQVEPVLRNVQGCLTTSSNFTIEQGPIHVYQTDGDSGQLYRVENSLPEDLF